MAQYEIYRHYNVSTYKEEEKIIVLNLESILDYLDLDTTEIIEEESFNKIKKYIGKEKTFNSNRAS